MPNLEIKHLFTYNRFSDKYDKLLYTVLYLPVGLILFLLRSILALAILLVGLLLPDTPVVQKIINKITCLSLGVSVNIENPNEVENVKVYVSNSLSIFDHLAVFTAVGAVSPGPETNPFLSKALGIHYFGSPSNMSNFRKTILAYISDKGKVYFTPEGKATNGRALLKFKTYPFSLAEEIQPINISIKRPFVDLTMSCVGSGYWTDVFFYMISPVTIYNLRFLPVQSKGSSTDEEIANTVRQLIAQKSGVQLVDFTASELIEWEKRRVAQQQRTRVIHEPNHTLKFQALQIKDVLPHVPLNVIYEDLSRTRSVDSTISNILEGHVSFVPEQPNVRRAPTPSPSPSSSTNHSPSTSKPTFGSQSIFPKSAEDRYRSFQERKEQLIAAARRRYIEKHNLDIPF